ncbi:MAG TPA: EI24 domain-containing protein [Polyangiaceae bacterium]|nr:EI24 domain-containing protein [Polyangiaceae bacterium]
MPAAPTPPTAHRLTFRQGLAAPWQAAWFLLRTPRTWPLALIPLGCALVVAVALVGLAALFLPGAIERWLPPGASPYGEAGRWALTLLALVAALLLSLVAGLLLAQPLASPALERLARLYDASIGRPPPGDGAPFWVSAARSLRASLFGLAALPVLVALMIVDLLVPGAFVVLVPLKILVSGFFLAWDYLDYPLGLRGWRARDRVRWATHHLPALLGMGASLAVALLVPLAQLFVLPVGVVAAALLYQRSPSRAP